MKVGAKASSRASNRAWRQNVPWLVRQARRRFGEACAAALAPLLETCEEPEALAEVGEWIVTCDSEETLLASVRTGMA